MLLLDTLKDLDGFGGLPAFRNLRSWRAWLTFLAAFYGLPLDDEQEALFKKHTGLPEYLPPEGGWRQAVAIVGRQGGKSRIGALVAGFEAINAPREPDSATLYSLLVTQDSSGAVRTLWSYVSAIFEEESPFRRRVASKRKGALVLDSEVVLAAYPCDPGLVRGLRSRVVVLDDLAYYLSPGGALIDRELLSVVRPSLASTNGRLLVLSAPSSDKGVLFQTWQDHYGKPGAPVLVWQASGPDMNPTLSTGHLDRMREEDPEAYRLEVLAEFPGAPREEPAPAPGSPDGSPSEAAAVSPDAPPPAETAPPAGSAELEHRAPTRVARCCYCGSREVQPTVPRGLRERLLFALPIAHPYRCRRCGGRYAALAVGSHLENRRRDRAKNRMRAIARRRVLQQWLLLALAILGTAAVVWWALHKTSPQVPDEQRPILTPLG